MASIRARFLALVVAVASLHSASASHSREEAEPLTLGIHERVLSPFETMWFGVDIPEGKALVAAYRILAGNPERLYLYDDEGLEVASASNGSSISFDPDVSTVWMRVTARSLAAHVQLNLSTIQASVHDDAGTGSDAPNTRGHARAISTQSISGKLAPGAGDRFDWYSSSVPADWIVDLGPSDLFVTAFDAQGNQLAVVGDSPGDPATVAFVVGTPPMLLRAFDHVTNFYDFSWSTSPRSDLRIEAIEIRDVPVVSNGDVTVSRFKDVLVTLTNQGPGSSRDAHLRVVSTAGNDSYPRLVDDQAISLAANDNHTFTARWDTAGQFGNVRLDIEVTNSFDIALGDNSATTTTQVIAAADGIDLLNQDVDVRRDVWLGWRYGADGATLRTPVGSVTLPIQLP